MIPLSRPDISELEVEEVLSVLRTHALSLGPKLAEFEERFAALLGVRYAVAVCNGTAGLHLAVRAAGIEPDAEVITTPFSFVASANVMLFERAIPMFVDIDRQTLNLTPGAVSEVIEGNYRRTTCGLVNRRSGRKLVGLLPVDVFGHPTDVDGFRALAERYGIWLVEDACEALGSEIFSSRLDRWVPAGSLADLAVFAFYPNKQITTGEGGVVATNNPVLAERCRIARNQGRDTGSEWLDHVDLGFNYRMDELSAALGVAQLRRFGELRARREKVAWMYENALRSLPGVYLPAAAPGTRVNWFVYVIRLSEEINRRVVSALLHERGIATRAYFPPIHLQPLYRRLFGFSAGTFPVCEAVAKSTLALPFFNTLSEEHIELVATTLREGVGVCVSAGHA